MAVRIEGSTDSESMMKCDDGRALSTPTGVVVRFQLKVEISAEPLSEMLSRVDGVARQL
jgi:hypothetical protein